MDTVKALFSLIRYELNGTEIDAEIKNSISMDTLLELYSLSSKHDLAHIVGSALSKADLLKNDIAKESFKKAILKALYRYELSEYESGRIYEAFNNSKIPFIPLKGAVIRAFYPKPWLRTSCDIDILVHEEDLERAVSVLVEEYNYKADEKKGYHDVSLFTPNGVHLELHFNIKENNETLDKVLADVWHYALPSEELNYKYELTKEFLLFHIIAHLSFHFVTGGCGIRPFLDLYLLENALSINKDIFINLLSQAKLLEFYENIKKLSAVWFEDKTHRDVTKQMENYILLGGAYGSLENKVLIQRQKKNGRLSYTLHRIFMPHNSLKLLYPVIIKHRWLTPFVQVHRWGRIVLDGRAKRSMKELSYNNNISKSKTSEMKDFLKEIGL